MSVKTEDIVFSPAGENWGTVHSYAIIEQRRLTLVELADLVVAWMLKHEWKDPRVTFVAEL